MLYKDNILLYDEDPFLDFVEKVAKRNGKIFVLDSGEGNTFVDPDSGWLIEELSGWYIEPKDKDRLVKIRDKDREEETSRAYVDFSDEYVFVKWSLKDGELKVYFVKY